MRFSETTLDVLKQRCNRAGCPCLVTGIPESGFNGHPWRLAHGGDYVTPALYFKEKGIATVSYDLRGHKQEKPLSPALISM
ncbi:MAG: hypothetical protein R2861_13710 [Desulfobacterales bacterium]